MGAASVTSTHRSDAAGPVGASRSAEPPSLEPLWLAWSSFWWQWVLGHPSRVAPEFLLHVSPHCGLLLLQPSQGALLQRPWAFRGVHHSQRILLAVLMHDFGEVCFLRLVRITEIALQKAWRHV